MTGLERPDEPPMLTIRSMVPTDNSRVLALNAQARPHVAALDGPELERLQALSQAHLVAEDLDVVVGYVISFARDDAYDGEEFERLRALISEPFVYIDQVVVLGAAHRAGIGGRLYGAVEQLAALRAARSLCCEVNTTPANPRSLAFHGRMGFASIGSLATRDGRIVQLLQKRLVGAA